MHHPDRHANATDIEKKEQEKKFKEVGEAYGVLSDPKKKARYDSGQDLEDFDGVASGRKYMNCKKAFNIKKLLNIVIWQLNNYILF